jgi:signal transduction histidine kinase/ketosteroid isomerase-like protein
MKLTKKLEAEILQVYNSYWDNYIKGNVEAMPPLLADEYTQVGSAEAEVFFNKKDAVNFLYDTIDQVSGKLEMRNRETKVEQLEHSILIHELCDLYALAGDKWIFYSRFRASTFMQQKKQGWKIIHQHSSFPDAKAEGGQNIAIDKIAEENLQLREAVKRRTIELEEKNKELAIDASLERVRAVALGMTSPQEMLEICRIICNELTLLGIKEIRNIQTAVFYTEKGTYMNYEYYRKHTKSIITEVDYSSKNVHKHQREFAKKMLSGDGAFYTKTFKGQQLTDWYNYQKGTEQLADRYLLKAHSLNYYMFSLGFVTLGISTYYPLSKLELELFYRFRNVFQLAYRRYLDIEKAEAQAQEAQIELALERVRARTMAMHKSDELPETSHLLFEQMKELGEPVEQLTIGIVNEENNVIEISATLLGDTLQKIYSHSIDEPYMMAKVYKAWKKQQKTLVVELRGDELNAYNRYRNELTNSKMFPTNLGKEHLRIVYAAFFSKGMLALGVNETRSPESLHLLVKFASVFDLTYTRFLDLQKAEAQARESEIELALERVRARTMAMQKSTELREIVAIIYEQLQNLGFTYGACGIVIMDEVSGNMNWWMAGFGKGDYPENYNIPYFNHPFYEQQLTHFKKGDKYAVMETSGKEKKRYDDIIFSKTDFAGINPEAKKIMTSFDKITFSNANMKHGALSWGPNPIDNEHAVILQRFAKVFEQTYTRFLDLQKAEAQALRAEQDLIAIKEAKQKAEEALTELQATQKQLIQSEKMASLGELTAGIAHEIQNPLNFVNNFSEVSSELIDELKGERQKAEGERNTNLEDELLTDISQNLEKINHHGKRAADIVKGMLQHSRSSSGVKEPTDINALADEYLRLAYHGLRAKDKSFNANMVTDFDETIGNINIIPQDMGRAILNLITNAFYAVNERYKVEGVRHKEENASNLKPSTLNPTPPYEPTVEVSTKKDGNKIFVSVKDNGNGIPQKILDKIFQPFFTTKPTGQGTGLGLSLSYDIVKAHGGELKVETKEGEGSVFQIILPISTS